jgi:hypothetical protein
MKTIILKVAGVASVLALAFSGFLYYGYTHFPDSDLYLSTLTGEPCYNQPDNPVCQNATPWQAFKHDWLGAYQ